jgi:hypothetical protein
MKQFNSGGETMKCEKRVGALLVKRVSDKEASKMVATGDWEYSAKKYWKIATGRVYRGKEGV